MGRFAGRVALVSGAAGGIGAAVADRLAEDGAMWSVADSPTSGRTRLRRDRRRLVRRAVAHCSGHLGRLDVLATWRHRLRGSIGDSTPRTGAASSRSTSPARSCYRRRGPRPGRVDWVIVNMGSVAGLRATPYNAAYCASKGGVIMLTKSMAIELAKAGVGVNAVCPASVDTPFLRNFQIPEGADLSLFTRAASPMGRVIDPTEVAAAVAYLASDDARTVSGTTLVIDGAATA